MMNSGRFSCSAVMDTVQVDGLRLLLVLTGLYLPLALAARLFSFLYVRRQSWVVEENFWTCEETALVLGFISYKRVFRIPSSAIVYRMTGDGGDPAFLLSGIVWMFILVMLGAARIHTGLSGSSPETLLTGIFLAVLGLAVDAGCVLLHQGWMRRETWQIGLLNGRSWTLAEPRVADPA